MNFDVLKYIVEYAEKKNQLTRKNLEFSIVSNLMILDQKKLNFLIEHQVSICTSLDGDEVLHNQNRPYFQNNTFQILRKKIEGIREHGGQYFLRYRRQPNIHLNDIGK
ncbi:MAG: hypothetical protein V8Q83_09300 [Blautia sp.]